jgi:hypothetical protein
VYPFDYEGWTQDLTDCYELLMNENMV